MARLVLAILVVIALVLAGLLALRAMRPEGTDAAEDGAPLRQIAFALLIGLTGYVALAGGD